MTTHSSSAGLATRNPSVASGPRSETAKSASWQSAAPDGLDRVDVAALEPPAQRIRENCVMTDIPARLSIITLGTRNISVLRSFYRGLGWPEIANGDDTWTGFHLGGVMLALFPMPDLTAE